LSWCGKIIAKANSRLNHKPAASISALAGREVNNVEHARIKWILYAARPKPVAVTRMIWITRVVEGLEAHPTLITWNTGPEPALRWIVYAVRLIRIGSDNIVAEVVRTLTEVCASLGRQLEAKPGQDAARPNNGIKLNDRAIRAVQEVREPPDTLAHHKFAKRTIWVLHFQEQSVVIGHGYKWIRNVISWLTIDGGRANLACKARCRQVDATAVGSDPEHECWPTLWRG
jgi:hypothetical protein